MPWLRLTPWAVPLALMACGPPQPANGPWPVACLTGQTSAIRDALYFGFTTPDGTRISEAEWQTFLRDAVTQAFPAGFTVLEGAGQWLGASGAVVREPSRVVVLLHPASAEADERIRDVVRRYRQEFRQEAVMWERTAACLSFEG